MDEKERISLELKKFLDNPKETQTYLNSRTLIKTRFDDNFDLIYCSDWSNFNFQTKFEYLCFYNKRTQQCYGRSAYPFHDIPYIQSTNVSIKLLNTLIAEKVNEWANSFDVKTAKSLGGKIRDEEYFLKYHAKSRAQDLIVDGLTADTWNSAYVMSEDNITYDMRDILYSTLTPETIANEHFEKFKAEMQEDVLAYILEMNVIYNEMKKIEEDKSNVLFKKARIRNSLNIENQKTVTVTINKKKADSDEFAQLTFKYPTRDLFYSLKNDYCSEYNMPAQDRAKFIELFGRSADIKAEDIVKIEYSKKVLFEEQN